MFTWLAPKHFYVYKRQIGIICIAVFHGSSNKIWFSCGFSKKKVGIVENRNKYNEFLFHKVNKQKKIQFLKCYLIYQSLQVVAFFSASTKYATVPATKQNQI